MYDGFFELVALAQNWSILQARKDLREDQFKINFDYFQIQKWMLQTVRVEKVDEKKNYLSRLYVFFKIYVL